jgi:acyl carrier protein
VLQKNSIQMGVMRMDWHKVPKYTSRAEVPKRLSLLISASGIEPQGGEEGSRLQEALLHATPEEREAIVQTYIREQVARVLGASPAKLDLDRPLNELGLDSLMSVELKNRVEGDGVLSLPMSAFTQSPTINSLSTAMLNQLIPLASTPSASPLTQGETSEQLLAKVEQLSEQEVDVLLHAMVGEEADETVS